MALSSHLALEDVGALLLGPSFLMADSFGPFLDEDEEDPSSVGRAPPLSFSSYADPSAPSSPLPSLSPLPPLSPPPSPLPVLAEAKPAVDLLSIPWLSADLLSANLGADDKADGFSSMDWMAEKIDLSDFDLDSLIGSCDLDEPPSSPEELLASLESHMDLDALPFPVSTSSVLPPAPLPEVPPPTQELLIKSEPLSPPPNPLPLSPAYTLELGSEVDVSELRAPGLVLSLTPSHIMLLLTPKEESSLPPSGELSDSDSGVSSMSGSPPRCSSPSASPPPTSCRTKPYSGPVAKVKSVSGAPKVVEKKLKKMAQNKTAATRYRQKKRVEQESLSSECAGLERRNRELAEKADSISREIHYLKDLMEEVRSAKNRKPKAAVP